MAEVLITLGIIGVVAAMTLPALISKHQNKVFAVRAKKSYSLINQAIQRAQADNDSPGDITGVFDITKTSAEVLTDFAKYFDSPKICLDFKGSCNIYKYDALYASPMYSKDGVSIGLQSGVPFMVLKDGSTIRIVQYSACEWDLRQPSYNTDGTAVVDKDGNQVMVTATERMCAQIFFDTNGYAKPNQYGADMFEIRVRKDGTFFAPTNFGWTSLQSILQGKDPVYTKYKKGVSKN